MCPPAWRQSFPCCGQWQSIQHIAVPGSSIQPHVDAPLQSVNINVHFTVTCTQNPAARLVSATASSH